MPFKEILKYLKKYKIDVYKTIIASLVIAGLNTLIPAIYGSMVDIILKGTFNSWLSLLLLLWLITTVTIGIITRYFTDQRVKIAVACERDLVILASSHLIELPWSFHKEKKIGELFEKIIRGGTNLSNIIDQIIFSMLGDFLTIAIILIIITLVNFKLTLIILAIIIIYTAITLSMTRKLITLEEKLDKSYEITYGNICDSVLNTKAVKSFTAELEEKHKYKSSYEKILEELRALIKIWINTEFLQTNIMGIGFIAIFGAALLLLSKQEITAGQLVMLIGYTSLIFKPFNNLSRSYIMIKRNMVSIERVKKLLEEKRENYREGVIANEIEGKVRFKNVHFTYAQDQDSVLQNINFTVEPGQMIALVGESGAGKTTLVELITRFIEPTKGAVYLDGMNVTKINLHSLRQKIASVPQEIILFNDTIRNNIRFGRFDATDEEITEAAKAANAHEFIKKFKEGYNQMVGERGIKLSAGQKQRIAIARAILRDPKILVLDEATSALDSKSEKLIQEALRKLIKGRTTFVIAHRLSTIRHADKILVLENGKIIEKGTHKELLAKKGTYRELHDLQKF